MSKVRIGIDVGGTFTDAVAIDNTTYEVIAKKKIPTTHIEGVAIGVVKIIKAILYENNILPSDVVFIAHGTTQATNALLEGDVASVGIIGMGTGIDSISAKKETNVENIELAPGKFLRKEHVFLDSSSLNENSISDAVGNLINNKCDVIVASEAYSVDNPDNEIKVIKIANEKKVFATGGHEISQLYGLKMRTRTAVVNASLIPRMMNTANMTEQAVIDTSIKSNLMIMRCDGGVMSINEVRKRPILTMLSGLAAGVAGALMYEKVSDGIFFEVGGTSVDISVIKNGKVMIKYAQVGGHKTYLRSLDVRTLAVAGGSMIRVRDKKIVDVGPRSAHIAGLGYECFTEKDEISNPKIKFISPREEDACEYVVVESENGKIFSLTLAGASNILDYVPEDDYARGNVEEAKKAWCALAEYLGITLDMAVKQVMKIALDKLTIVVDELINEYELDRKFITLVGGGGSGAVIVNALAEACNFKWKIAKNAPYISTIGVALAMVREQIERTISNPNEGDIKQIRADVIERIVKSGATEETVEVNIEIDSQKNIVRAIATGATELRNKDLNAKALNSDELLEIAADALVCNVNNVKYVCATGRWNLIESEVIEKKFFNLIKSKLSSCCVIDREGVVRFKKEKVKYTKFIKDDIQDNFIKFVDENTTYSDANATIPKIFLFFKEKMIDLTGMQNMEQLLSIMKVEIEYLSNSDEIIAIAYK